MQQYNFHRYGRDFGGVPSRMASPWTAEVAPLFIVGGE